MLICFSFILQLLGQAAPAQSPNGKDSGNEWYLMD
jgi:hypothetical protein